MVTAAECQCSAQAGGGGRAALAAWADCKAVRCLSHRPGTLPVPLPYPLCQVQRANLKGCEFWVTVAEAMVLLWGLFPGEGDRSLCQPAEHLAREGLWSQFICLQGVKASVNSEHVPAHGAEPVWGTWGSCQWWGESSGFSLGHLAAKVGVKSNSKLDMFQWDSLFLKPSRLVTVALQVQIRLLSMEFAGLNIPWEVPEWQWVARVC